MESVIVKTGILKLADRETKTNKPFNKEEKNSSSVKASNKNCKGDCLGSRPRRTKKTYTCQKEFEPSIHFFWLHFSYLGDWNLGTTSNLVLIICCCTFLATWPLTYAPSWQVPFWLGLAIEFQTANVSVRGPVWPPSPTLPPLVFLLDALTELEFFSFLLKGLLVFVSRSASFHTPVFTITDST